jgi:hypothetical protein
VTEEVWEEGGVAVIPEEIAAAAAPAVINGKGGSGGPSGKAPANSKGNGGASKTKAASAPAGGQKGIMSFFGKK